MPCTLWLIAKAYSDHVQLTQKLGLSSEGGLQH